MSGIWSQFGSFKAGTRKFVNSVNETASNKTQSNHLDLESGNFLSKLKFFPSRFTLVNDRLLTELDRTCTLYQNVHE